MSLHERAIRVIEAAQWQRGLRAGFVIGTALIACLLLHIPFGYAAFGAYTPIVVDNGGPYRVRLQTMLLALLGGALASALGAMVPLPLLFTLPVTAAACFLITFSRVISQPLASTSVMILVLYFAGLGGTKHDLHSVVLGMGLFLLGGAWAVMLSLLFWPIDPFRPARIAVGLCYESLGEMIEELQRHPGGADGVVPAEGLGLGEDTPGRVTLDPFAARRKLRIRMEAARTALASTSARAPSRSVLARQLTVLLETADMLLARISRLAELQEIAADAVHHTQELSLLRWLGGALRAIAGALAHHPADDAASFAEDGSHRLDVLTRHRAEMKDHMIQQTDSASLLLRNEEVEALLELEIAFDAVRTVWTGAEPRLGPNALTRPGGQPQLQPGARSLLETAADALRTNWSAQSMMFRHAIRITCVGCLDVVLLRLVHINHGYWLPVTSIIVLQPYGTGTLRKSFDRVAGTVTGAILAALIAAVAQSEGVLIAVIIVCATLAMATFAVDYAIFCFFVTPTFVLLSLPHLHDWQYAGVRIGTTLMGASVAILAMRLLLPERAELELSRLFRRGAAADAEYLRAMLRFWSAPAPDKPRVEREVLAPARRACGLASNDAEEAVDRVMLEPALGALSGRGAAASLRLREQALSSATYLRRLTQSITTLARVGDVGGGYQRPRVQRLLTRIEHLAGGDPHRATPPEMPVPGSHRWAAAEPQAEGETNFFADQQMLRLERQVTVLEKAAQAFP